MMASQYVYLIWRSFLLIFSVYTTYQFNANGEMTTNSNDYPRTTGKVTTSITDNYDPGNTGEGKVTTSITDNYDPGNTGKVTTSINDNYDPGNTVSVATGITDNYDPGNTGEGKVTTSINNNYDPGNTREGKVTTSITDNYDTGNTGKVTTSINDNYDPGNTVSVATGITDNYDPGNTGEGKVTSINDNYDPGNTGKVTTSTTDNYDPGNTGEVKVTTSIADNYDPGNTGKVTTSTTDNYDPGNTGKVTTSTTDNYDPGNTGEGKVTTSITDNYDPGNTGKVTTNTTDNYDPGNTGKVTTSTTDNYDPGNTGEGKVTTSTTDNYDPGNTGEGKVTTSESNIDNTVTARSGDNTRMTTSSGVVEDMTTISQSYGNTVETSSTDNANMVTTSSGNVVNKETDGFVSRQRTTSGNMTDTTTPSVVSTDEGQTDTNEAATGAADKPPFYAAVFGTKISITGYDQLVLNESSLVISCSLSDSRITELLSIHLYRTMHDSVYLESIVSIGKLKNESVLHWTNKMLGNRAGVSASGKIDPVHNAHLTFSIAPNYTLCEDAVEYKCVMTVGTTAGERVAVSNSKHVALYPPVEPTHTNGILVSPTFPVSSDGIYTIPVDAFVQFTCTGTVGSDKRPHEWRLISKMYIAGTCYYDYSDRVDQQEDYLVREGCNFKRTSVFTISVDDPNGIPFVEVWCRPYVAPTSVGDCDELSDTSLVRHISIDVVANPNDTSARAQPRRDIPYVVPSGRITCRDQQTLQLDCYWAGRQAVWFFRPEFADTATGIGEQYLSLNQTDERNITTLIIHQCSVAHRGFYTCPMFNFQSTANQTVFVDIVYDTCRNNGIWIPGGGCMAIVSEDECLSSNGSMATIHTPQKSRLIYILTVQSRTEVSIGLIIKSNRMLWNDFVWVDGSSLTYTEKIRTTFCIACKEEREFPLTIGMTVSGYQPIWHEANPLSDVVCEWKERENITGITIPPRNSTYSGTKPLFQCTLSGEFISTVFVCDQTYDCNDDSDEDRCAPGCSGTSFQCESGGCISASSVCDFYTNCPDGSDEQNCNHQTCEDGYWQCDNLDCIPVYDVCDGEEECADGSDEAEGLCTDRFADQKPTEYTFSCLNPNRMLPSSRICDGFKDCFSMTDEYECQPTYHSCGAWAISTHGINSTATVDYGMEQYGAVTVRCVDDKKIYTTWPFSADQQFTNTYTLNDRGGSYVTHALWFELWIFHNLKYQPISYQSRIQQLAMMSSATTCVQYIRPCGYFQHATVTVAWSNGNGQFYNMHFIDTFGCTGYCRSDGCKVIFDYDVIPTDHSYYDGKKDFGWVAITDKEQLPVTMVRTTAAVVLGISRLICSEDVDAVDIKHTDTHLQCKSGNYYSPSRQCLMNFGPTGEPMACRDLSHLENCENVPCPEDYVKCPGSFCLHTSYICDGRSHCPNQEDEMDCDPHDCRGHYRCRATKQCIPLSYLCDGIRQCPRGDDERQCDGTCPRGCTCEGLAFVCDSEEYLRLDSIPSEARWISLKSNLSDIGNHIPLAFPMLATLILQNCFLRKLKIDRQSIFRNATALRHLDLSSNLIEILPDSIFSPMDSLYSLTLKNNPIVSISGQAFHGLKALKNLQMSHTGIKQLHAERSDTLSIFKSLTSLSYLDLSSNLIQILPSGIFDDLHSLKTLLLNNNPLLHIDVGAFSGLSALTSLQLSHTNPTRLETGVFEDLRSLLVLNISASNIEDLGYRIFERLHVMERLDIHGNQILVQEFMFAGLDGLQYLYADSYKACCIRPQTVLDENCFAPKDLISSCSNLIGSSFLRICLWVVGMSAVFGNLLVIVFRLVLDKANLKKSHSVFVINLGISDFCMGVFLVIIASVDTHFSGRYVVNDQAWRSSVLCKAAGSLSVISSEMSTFAILMVTVDRFIAIVFPLSLKKITWKSALVASSLLWIVSLAVAIVPQAFFESYFKGEFYSRSGMCLALPLTGGRAPGEEYAVAIFIGLNGLLFLVILFAQIAIRRSCSGNEGIVTSHNRKQDIAVARSLFLVVATDFCCWFPLAVMGAWSQLGGSLSADVYAWVMVFVLPINSAINPFLYTYTYLKRQRESVTRKKVKLNSKQGNVSSSDGLNMSSSVKDVYFSNIFKRREGSITLKQHARTSKLSPSDAYRIARRTIEALSFLHDRHIVHGNVTEECVHINVTGKVMKDMVLTLDMTPINGNQDTTTDVLQYGMLVKKLLRMLDRY